MSTIKSASLSFAPRQTCCQKMMSWVTWGVCFPVSLVKVAYNSARLVKNLDLYGIISACGTKKPISFLGFGNLNFHVISDRTAIQAVLKGGCRTDESGFFHDVVNAETFFPILKDLIPVKIGKEDFLFTCSSKNVRHLRATVLAHIGPRILPELREFLGSMLPQLCDQLKVNQAIDCDAFTSLVTTGVIARFVLELEYSFERYQKINQAIQFLTDFAIKKRWVKNPDDLQKYQEALINMQEAIDEALQKNGRFIQLLESDKLTPVQKKCLLFLLFMAGSESTTNVLKFFLWHLAQTPSAQNEIADDEGIDDKFRTAEAFLNESLRLFPSAYIVPRFARVPLLLTLEFNDKKKKNLRIEAGEALLCAPLLDAKDPQKYSNPETFARHRFTGTEGTLPWFPFGSGEHACPGQWLARAEITYTAKALVDRFRITSLTPNNLTLKGLMTLKIAEKVTLLLERRAENKSQ